MKKNTSRKRSPKARRGHPAKPGMVLGVANYKVMAIGVVAVLAGFLMMYMENEVDGIISLYVSPIIIVGGFAEIVYATMKEENPDKGGKKARA